MLPVERSPRSLPSISRSNSRQNSSHQNSSHQHLSHQNLSHQRWSLADRIAGQGGRIRSGHSKSAVGIPSEMESNPRTMPSPSCSPAPPIRPTQSSSPARQIGNTPAGSGSTDDRPSKRNRRERVAVHSSPAASPLMPFPPHFLVDETCVRRGRLGRYQSAPVLSKEQPPQQLPPRTRIARRELRAE